MLCGLESDYKRVEEVLMGQCFRDVGPYSTMNPYKVTMEALNSTIAIVRNDPGMSSPIVSSQKDENARPLESTKDLDVCNSGMDNAITPDWNPSLVVGLSRKRRFSEVDEEATEEVSKRSRISEDISQTAKKIDRLSLTENSSLAPGVMGPANQLTPDSTEAAKGINPTCTK